MTEKLQEFVNGLNKLQKELGEYLSGLKKVDQTKASTNDHILYIRDVELLDISVKGLCKNLDQILKKENSENHQDIIEVQRKKSKFFEEKFPNFSDKFKAILDYVKDSDVKEVSKELLEIVVKASLISVDFIQLNNDRLLEQKKFDKVF